LKDERSKEPFFRDIPKAEEVGIMYTLNYISSTINPTKYQIFYDTYLTRVFALKVKISWRICQSHPVDYC
jgi:hypothetical protein